MAAAMPPSAMTVCALPSSDLQTSAVRGAVPRGLDRRAQPGAAGADDDDVVVVRLVLGHAVARIAQKNLGSWMAPLATRRT